MGEKWNHRRVSVLPPADESSKCCLASEAAREAQFGEGCHLEGGLFRRYDAPPSRAHAGAVSSTAAASLSLHLCATLHTSSHTSSSHLPVAFLLAASKPDAPVLKGRGGGGPEPLLTPADGQKSCRNPNTCDIWTFSCRL